MINWIIPITFSDVLVNVFKDEQLGLDVVAPQGLMRMQAERYVWPLGTSVLETRNPLPYVEYRLVMDGFIIGVSMLGRWENTNYNLISVTFHLIHWGRVTHICVGKITIISSDYCFSPGRHQASIWANAGTLLIGPIGTDFSEILTEIYTFSFKKMHLKMSFAKWRPFCLNVLNRCLPRKDTYIMYFFHFFYSLFYCFFLSNVCEYFIFISVCQIFIINFATKWAWLKHMWWIGQSRVISVDM